MVECLILFTLLVIILTSLWQYKRNKRFQEIKKKKKEEEQKRIKKEKEEEDVKYQEPVGLLYKDMKSRLITKDKLDFYKKKYDTVLAAIYSIPPATRENICSHPLIEFNTDLDSIKQAKHCIIKKIKRDFMIDNKNKLPLQLKHQIEDVFDQSSYALSYRDDYCEIKLSPDSGGTSTINVGVVGLKRISKNVAIVGLSLYHEKWIEDGYISINLKHEVWNKDNVEAFAKYLLYQKVSEQIQCYKENRNTIQFFNKVEDKGDLHTWLSKNNLLEYYEIFKKNGYDDFKTITYIKNEKELKDIGINKIGHVKKIMQLIKASTITYKTQKILF